MDWILAHLQFVFIVVFALISYFIKAAQKPKDGSKPGSKVAPAPDPEEAARTRRIQEEIQRKILERRMGRAAPEPVRPAPSARTLPPPLVAPRPVSSTGMGGLREKLDARLAEQRAREAARRAAEENERRVALKEQQEEVDRRELRRRLEIQAALKEAARTQSVAEAAASKQAATANPWLGELRDPNSARRAMVLREVLGTPVGLR